MLHLNFVRPGSISAAGIDRVEFVHSISNALATIQADGVLPSGRLHVQSDADVLPVIPAYYKEWLHG